MKKFTLYDSNGNDFKNLKNDEGKQESKQNSTQEGGVFSVLSPLIPTALSGSVATGRYPRAERYTPSLSEFAPGSGLMPATPAFTSTTLTPSLPLPVIGAPLPVGGPMPFGRMSPIIRNPAYMGPMTMPPYIPVGGPLPGVPGIGLAITPSTTTGGVVGSGYIISAPKLGSRTGDVEYIVAKEFDDKAFLMAPFPISIPTGRTYKNNANIFGRYFNNSGIYNDIDNANNALMHITESNVRRANNGVSFTHEVVLNGRRIRIFLINLNTPISSTHASLIRFDSAQLEACARSGATTCVSNSAPPVSYTISSTINDTLRTALTSGVFTGMASIPL